MVYKIIFPEFLDDRTCRFTVWAPDAQSITLVTESSNQKIPLNKIDFGYWETITEDVPAGTLYKYQINGSDAFPDPASLSQPKSVHGASEVINLKDFKWTDASWKGLPIQDMIQYELHTGTFTKEGTFAGINSKLDYLLDLGVNTIEILPVSQFSGHRNWGYDGVYPFAVQNTYGGAKELMKLVDACHSKGLAVILDVVYNHFGPEGNYVSNFGHYFSGKYSTPWGNPVNFDDAYSDGVRNYIVQNALMWLRDFHIDGLRLDAVHAIYDFSADHILKELADNVDVLSKKTKKMYHLIAESHLNDVRYISAPTIGGYGMDAQWSDDFHHSIHTLVTGENNGYYMDFGEPSQLSKAIKDAFVYDGKYSPFRKKTYGNTTDKHSGHQFVIFNQNHDQVGNRKFGERLIALTDFETAKLVAGTMFVSPNIPMLFMGEEYAERNPFQYFVSHLSKELNKLVSEGRRQEFKDFYDDDEPAPDPSLPETFNNSRLSWGIDEDPEKKAMLGFYRSVIALRKSHPALRTPDKQNLSIEENNLMYTLERWQENNKIVCLMNFADSDQTQRLQPETGQTLHKILDSADTSWKGPGSVSPHQISESQEVSVKSKSIVVYSNVFLS